MREFAEAEIVVPSGPYEGRRYTCDKQPYSRLWFDALVNPNWRRFIATGPTQSGKTLTCFVVPTLYHLFEVKENVVCGIPSMDMAADKWNEDLLPAIERSRFRDMLPSAGAGSKGGASNINAIRFRNGATLKFMSGGGGDKSRAGFTSRVIVITETDGMDESSGSSREADKITQIEGRIRAYGDRGLVYMECTVSLEEGRTWQEYTRGTNSRIAVRCPHCANYVTPEREHLIGWQDATDIIEAGEKVGLACPSCGQVWTEEDRGTANRNSILVHKGQTVTVDGAVVGDLPRTNTLGFRWTAANNMLIKMPVIGQDEWKASRAANEDNAEKEMRQFVWALPHKPSKISLTTMDHTAVMERSVESEPKGRCPDDTECVTLGVDVGKWYLHWVAIAWRPNATPHVVEYGRREVDSAQTAEERAILTALRDFRDSVVKEGWESASGRKHAKIVLIDSRYKKEVAFAFCDESGQPFFPSMGYGTTQRHTEKFVKRAREKCTAIGEEYQVVKRNGSSGLLVEINADHWKGWVHGRLQTPKGQPGAISLFHAPSKIEHLSFAKHLTAEKKEEVFESGRGLVTRWRMMSRNNHLLDATSLACVAGHIAGVRLIGESVPAASPPAQTESSYNPVSSYRGRW